MVKLVDTFGCGIIIDALKNMPAEADADVVISTAHKSKGREWNRVRLAGDFPTVDKMSDEDFRLLYVACTRAKLHLDLSHCPAFVGGDEEGRVIAVRFTGSQPLATTEPHDLIDQPSLQTESSERNDQPVPETEPFQMIDQPKVETEPLETNDQLMYRTEPNGQNGLPLDENFTWGKLPSGAWAIRGPRNGLTGRRVIVRRKNGTESVETLGAMIQERFGAFFYVQVETDDDGEGEPVCASCGEPGYLVKDDDDGLLKHRRCCDQPPPWRD